MPYTKDDVGQPARADGRQLTDEERQAIADEWNANEAAKPLNDWNMQMNESDQRIFPRWAEDIVDGLIAAGISVPQNTVDKRNSKRVLRNSRPA